LNKKNSITGHYKTYQLSALDKNLDFQFSLEEFEKMVSLPCTYCGVIQEKGFNGIDRLNSSEPYIQSNCVSCCEMCNMMKGSSGPNVFVHRAEHILTNLKIIEGELYPSEFLDIKGCIYYDYKKRAHKKELAFEISQDTFNHYTQLPCYLCGKEVSQTHTSGVDRLDNTKGYTIDNIRSCCGICNYTKRDYVYDHFIEKLCLICNYQQEHPVAPSLEEEEKRPIVKGNKITTEEKQERGAVRSETNRKALCDRYGSEEYIKDKAKELALKRNGM
jgi:hypothetical protein